MKLVVVEVDRGGGLVMEAGAVDELDGESRRKGRHGKFEALFRASFLGARTDVTRAQARSRLPLLGPIANHSTLDDTVGDRELDREPSFLVSPSTIT